MRDALIVSAVRTPIGRAGGALASVRADDLAAVALRQRRRAGSVSTRRGSTMSFWGARIRRARTIGTSHGWPSCSLASRLIFLGQTVNRLCGSGLQAVASAAQAIKAGEGDAFIAGGMEGLTRAPYVMLKTGNAWSRQAPTIADSTVGWRFINPQMSAQWTITLGMTAEKVAEHYGIGREVQDAFAAESQRRAAHAIREGFFRDEIVPVCIPQEGRDPAIVSADEHPRPETTLQTLAALEPAFSRGEHASVTAGNSSGINDGASALLVVADTEVADMKPLARIVTTAVAGVDPSVMGIGPVPAARKALARAGLTIDQIDLVELNEAFAAQSLACIRELGVDPEKVNVYGGAIALGHPLGSSGSRLVATLVHALRRRNARYGLATMCIGVGQGIATIVERL